jgi:CHAT domain-containing protein
LPSTATEVAAVQRLLPGSQLWTGTAASEAALKQVQGPRVLHMATHGFFLADPPPSSPRLRRLDLVSTTPLAKLREPPFDNPLLRAGLDLAGANTLQAGPDNGLLTALEVAGLDLWGTELVVLSACDTGLGQVRNGEGVYGLRRALVLAGTESQVMSLWSVEDDATQELMVGYYRRLQAGEGRAEALRQVQLTMLANPQQSHPFYWAAFLLSGAWTPLPRP